MVSRLILPTYKRLINFFRSSQFRYKKTDYITGFPCHIVSFKKVILLLKVDYRFNLIKLPGATPLFISMLLIASNSSRDMLLVSAMSISDSFLFNL